MFFLDFEKKTFKMYV